MSDIADIAAPVDVGAGEPDLPERTCIVTRKVGDPVDLVRFVLAPDGSVVPDIGNELPGRGAWVGTGRGLIEEAVRRRLFSRAFRADAKVDAGLAERTGMLLERRALELVSLANKAGQAVQGFSRVEEAIMRGRVGVLLQASDGAEDGRRKLVQKLRQVDPEAAVIEIFTSSQLDLAFGRTNVVHAGVAAGGLARRLEAAARRVCAFRDH